jgi:hypothetical protein
MRKWVLQFWIFAFAYGNYSFVLPMPMQTFSIRRTIYSIVRQNVNLWRPAPNFSHMMSIIFYSGSSIIHH